MATKYKVEKKDKVKILEESNLSLINEFQSKSYNYYVTIQLCANTYIKVLQKTNENKLTLIEIKYILMKYTTGSRGSSPGKGDQISGTSGSPRGGSTCGGDRR